MRLYLKVMNRVYAYDLLYESLKINVALVVGTIDLGGFFNDLI